MKSIVFFLLLLLSVATSGQMINGMGNLTDVYEDGESEVFGDFLAPNPKTYLVYDVTSKNRQPVCVADRYHKCLGVVNDVKFNECSVYKRCKHIPMPA